MCSGHQCDLCLVSVLFVPFAIIYLEGVLIEKTG